MDEQKSTTMKEEVVVVEMADSRVAGAELADDRFYHGWHLEEQHYRHDQLDEMNSIETLMDHRERAESEVAERTNNQSIT